MIPCISVFLIIFTANKNSARLEKLTKEITGAAEISHRKRMMYEAFCGFCLVDSWHNQGVRASLGEWQQQLRPSLYCGQKHMGAREE